MPVNSQNSEYKDNISIWKKCRDAYLGEDAVKKAGVEYLPLLSSMKTASDEKYINYKNRAMFYAATTRTVEGLVGMAMSKPATVEIPDKYKFLKEDMTGTGINLENFTKELISEVTLTARCGVLVDLSKEGGRPYSVIYPAEHIINWRTDSEGKLLFIVLVEAEDVINPQDKFDIQKKIVYRELYLDEETGRYNVSLWREDSSRKGTFNQEKLEPPVIRGKTLDYIPFTFVTSKGTDTDVEKPPLIDMINVNFSHYRSSADLEHGRHFTALPTPYVFGIEQIEDEYGNVTPITIGSETCLVSSSPQGSAGYMEFSGQGLQALERAMEEKSNYMMILGATILQTEKKGVEAADTARINKSSDSSTMSSIIMSVENALTTILEWMIGWEAIINEGSISVAMNKDLVDASIDAQTITALVGAWQGAAISHETLLHNLKQGEILPKDISIEDELSRIDDEEPEDLGEPLDLSPEERRRSLKIVKGENEGEYQVEETG